jgi:hypothetical protein
VQWSVFDTLLPALVGRVFATVLFYILVQKAGGIFASLVMYEILLWLFSGVLQMMSPYACLYYFLGFTLLTGQTKK